MGKAARKRATSAKRPPAKKQAKAARERKAQRAAARRGRDRSSACSLCLKRLQDGTRALRGSLHKWCAKLLRKGENAANALGEEAIIKNT